MKICVPWYKTKLHHGFLGNSVNLTRVLSHKTTNHKPVSLSWLSSLSLFRYFRRSSVKTWNSELLGRRPTHRPMWSVEQSWKMMAAKKLNCLINLYCFLWQHPCSSIFFYTLYNAPATLYYFMFFIVKSYCSALCLLK